VIAIVSPAAPERAALAALCASRGWVTAECDSLRALRQLLGRVRPRIVLTRRRLGDGFSDDVMSALAAVGQLATVKVIVLVAASTPAAVEARQVALGADCVQRDPVRTDVLVEFLAKYQQQAPRLRRVAPLAVVPKPFQVAGARIDPVARRIWRGKKTVHLTPHEVALAELLAESRGGLVAYETLFSEILGRRFRGDTSSMRVLLGKLAASAKSVGVALRDSVEVIPKLGYRYRPGSLS
jgi:DNA-binding response OmpR family regulator